MHIPFLTPKRAKRAERVYGSKMKDNTFFKKHVATEEKIEKRTPNQEIDDYLNRFFQVNCIRLGEVQSDIENEKLRVNACNKMAKRGLQKTRE